MAILLYNVSNGILLLMLISISIFMFIKKRKLIDSAFQMRRKSFIGFFVLLAIAIYSGFFIIHDGKIEIFATMPICLHYSAFVTFAMLASAYLGRKHYRNPYIWFFLMQYAVIMLILNIAMKITGNYTPVYHLTNHIIPSSGNDKFIFAGRVIWMGIVMTGFVFMIGMMIEAYVFYRRRKRNVSDLEQVQKSHEMIDVLFYIVILLLTMASFAFSSIVFHIIVNVMIGIMISRTFFVYNTFIHYTVLKQQGSFMGLVIEGELKKIFKKEENNPIYSSNTTIEEIAEVLHVSRNDLSKYLYEELNTPFSAWVSEKKLLRCAFLLENTDSMISEISNSTGYCNVQAMSKAFKMKYGVTPSEYRKEKMDYKKVF